MQRDILRLMRWKDMHATIWTAVICVALAIVLAAVTESPAGRWTVLVLFGGIGVGAAVSIVTRARFRYRELCKGHCPNPLCHGVVVQSENFSRDVVVCPVCGHVWPALSHMEFKTTSRQW
ncbi:MAG: hypothetical protein KBI47_07925 [Armatimonadetes bacterium]|jgi:hypothetical protein|nr:hypothetical protein [Armatimonadota bacterium]MDI9583303.1 hypothetical protein [Acidobacteriota bacterium]